MEIRYGLLNHVGNFCDGYDKKGKKNWSDWAGINH